MLQNGCQAAPGTRVEPEARGMNRLRPAALLASLVAMGCGAGDAVTPSDFVGGTWQLTSFQDGTSVAVAVPSPERYTLGFGSDGRATVKSDCNTCGGEYSLNGGSFRIGPLACTRAFCGATSLDPAYPAALDKARALTMDAATELTIHGDGVTLGFRKQSGASPSPSQAAARTPR